MCAGGAAADPHENSCSRTTHTEECGPAGGSRGGLTIWKLGHCPGSVGGPMRCPWYLFHRLF
ncbi:unnamed protein product [Staurois parvus]|uniref:Uncharacterized protein n=1 Tax=Staurois parvus TaxID=386267 RepID=A0ABN9D0K3_9NEOB|nr:unnamed protein product [Staurois parvus]